MNSKLTISALVLGTALTSGCGQRLLDFYNDHNDGGADLSANGDMRLPGEDLASSDGATDGGTETTGDLALECIALHLPGAPSQVDAPNEAFYSPIGPLTVEAWIYPTAEATDMVVAGHTGATGSTSYYLSVTSAGLLQFTTSIDGTTLVTSTSTATIPLNTWTHVAGQVAAGAVIGDTASTWINGVADGTQSAGLVFSVKAVTAPLGIGSFTSATTSSTAAADLQSFVGWMHDVRYSSVARFPETTTPPPVRLDSDASTLALYHFDDPPIATNAIDSSSHANNGQLLGSASFGQPPVCQ
jgi:hypothetical protein